MLFLDSFRSLPVFFLPGSVSKYTSNSYLLVRTVHTFGPDQLPPDEATKCGIRCQDGHRVRDVNNVKGT